VLAKETKYGIAKEYGISVKELERQNPNIIRGLAVGYKLNIRSKKIVEPIASKRPLSQFLIE
jgi:LysM repeat protein